MKNITFLLFTIFLCTACHSQEKQIEDHLLNCLTSKYNSQGVDITTELEALEKFLVDKKYLKTSDGSAYLEFFTRMSELNDSPVQLDYDEFPGVFKVEPSEYYDSTCIAGLIEIDTSQFRDSPLFRLFQRIENIKITKELSVSNLSGAYSEILKPSDFTHNLYRYTNLLAIVYTANPLKAGIKIPGKNSVGQKFISENKLIITVGKNDSIEVNNHSSSLEQLEFTLKVFLAEYKSDHTLEFNTSAGTSYDLYTRVQDVIKLCYDHVRDIESTEKFGISFESLSEERKKEIRAVIPKNVIEN